LRFGGETNEGASLSLQLALNVHQRGPGMPIVQHLVSEASRNTLWRMHLEQLAATQLFQLPTPSSLVTAFGVIAVRVGRIQRLQRDLRLLQSRYAQVHVSPQEGQAEISVLFSALPQRRRFWLRFKVDAEYPMGSTQWRIEVSIGGPALERQAKARVQETIRSLQIDLTKRFAWLPLLCADLEQWARSDLNSFF
jgi:hypothetical protein